jgi:hypothetical protein
MAAHSTKLAAGKGRRLIDLRPDEAAVLSLVAEYAKVPGVKTHLSKFLGASTRRARAIAGVILKSSAKARPGYRIMAKRFLDASANNVRNALILKASTPRDPWADGGL